MSRAMSGSVCASDGLLSDMGASMRRDAQAFGAATSRSPVVSPPTARQSQYPKATDPLRPPLRSLALLTSPLIMGFTGGHASVSCWYAHDHWAEALPRKRG